MPLNKETREKLEKSFAELAGNRVMGPTVLREGLRTIFGSTLALSLLDMDCSRTCCPVWPTSSAIILCSLPTGLVSAALVSVVCWCHLLSRQMLCSFFDPLTRVQCQERRVELHFSHLMSSVAHLKVPQTT